VFVYLFISGNHKTKKNVISSSLHQLFGYKRGQRMATTFFAIGYYMEVVVVQVGTRLERRKKKLLLWSEKENGTF